jgi:hypothetical protein
MRFSKTYKEVIADAKAAFNEIERTPKEKHMQSSKKYAPRLKNIGFIDGMKQMVVYQ